MPPANTDRALFLLRLVIGSVFIYYGYQKLFVTGPEGVTGYFASLNVPFAALVAWSVAVLEFAGGIALIVGIGTRVTASLLVVVMLAAIWFAKRADGFTEWAPEYVLAGVAAALAIAGAGALSMDAGWERKSAGDR